MISALRLLTSLALACFVCLTGCGGGTSTTDEPPAFPTIQVRQLAIRVPGAQGIVIALYQALYGKAPSYSQLQNLTAQAGVNQAAVIQSIAANFASVSDADLARQVLTNMNVTALTVGPPTASNLQLLVGQLFAAYGSGSRGIIIINLANILSDLEGDILYGPAAVGFNIQTLADQAYATNSGNGADSVVTPTPVFAIAAAYKRGTFAGAQATFTISGTCTGTGIKSESALSPAKFNGISGYSSTESLTMNFTACSPSTAAATGVSYYDANYMPLGTDIPGSQYGIFKTPVNLPTIGAVGATGVLGTESLFTDSTQKVSSGNAVLSYVVEPDTSTTAILNVISRTYNTSGQLIVTVQSRTRIDLGGNNTPLSQDLQYSTTSTTHLLLTYH